MSPALGWFQATLKLGNKSCIAKIQVHKCIQTPLLSFGHCQELAIILPDFPKSILPVSHINRCAEVLLPATTSPSSAQGFFLQEFRDVLVSKAVLLGVPLKKMHLKDDTVPLIIHMPRPILYAFQSQVKEKLESLVNQGIIEPAGSSSAEDPWASKPPATPSVSEMTWICRVLQIAARSWMTSSCSTRTFLYTCRGFTRCCEHGIILNKFIMATPSVDFCGYTLSRDSISLSVDKVSAIHDFPKLANLNDLRSFMGLVNQLAEFTHHSHSPTSTSSNEFQAFTDLDSTSQQGFCTCHGSSALTTSPGTLRPSLACFGSCSQESPSPKIEGECLALHIYGCVECQEAALYP
ncbi:hypothetical protein SK128_000367 [Halocaridina rubra]|uniref:Uncharacterized protein n=1 Tax=Halocaridina rubra TaxID=373956 RepID=A0AAN8X4F2_HALRR